MSGKITRALLEWSILLIITIPSFIALINNDYFPMHDDQHIARLVLLDQGIMQGSIFPRWVGGLGFGFGYPLFNFYPPLIYYLGLLFHSVGFSYIWSIKLVFMVGFILGAIGIFHLTKSLTNKMSAYFSVALFTYAFYHAVLIYVRGALAEFFAMSLIPYVFLFLLYTFQKKDSHNYIYLGVSIALLILCHPLIAFPTFLLLILSIIYFLTTIMLGDNTDKIDQLVSFGKRIIISIVIGLSLSAFFWIPSITEKQYTLTDTILTQELASYKLHYIYPQQFIYSPWGFGGSGVGLSDGMTMQLGKMQIGFFLISLFLLIVYIVGRLTDREKISRNYFFILCLFLFSLFMTTPYSSFIWDNVKYLWYLQFPWRFLTFTTVFVAVLGGYSIYLSEKILKQKKNLSLFFNKYLLISATLVLSAMTVLIYQKYFHPEKYLHINDNQRTTYDQLAWNVSRTSFEFIPKGVKTMTSSLKTTIPAIQKTDIAKNSYTLLSGNSQISQQINLFTKKSYTINVLTDSLIQINTFYFPGWNAYLDDQSIQINDNNSFKLIRVNVPKGYHKLILKFENTIPRTVGNVLSIIGLMIILTLLLKKNRVEVIH